VSKKTDPRSVRLRERYTEAAHSTRIGGASVLRELSELAECCVEDGNFARSAVAFTLCTIFGLHAGDRDDRAVTGDDTYTMMTAASDWFAAAVSFIEVGGSDFDALKIIAELALLTPKRLYGH
jgi:hypothetical protein